jgi:hypothetical protein
LGIFLFRHDPYAGQEESQPSEADAQAGAEKARQIMAVAREQNLTGGANRDDFARKMYLGLKGGKPMRRGENGEGNANDADKEKLMQLLKDQTSSSEDEYVEVVRAHPEVKKKDKTRKKGGKKRSRRYSSDDDDSSSDDSARRRRERRKTRKDKRKRKNQHRSSHRVASSDSDDHDSDDKRRLKKKRRNMDKRVSAKDDNHRKEKSSDKESAKESFIASSGFSGSKRGYVYRTGVEGVGYYIDAKPHVDANKRDEMLKLYQE